MRAGRGLVPTPRAIELREEVGPLVQRARAVLGPAERLDLSSLARTFTIRASEGFVENFGAQLLDRIEQETKAVRLRFLSKTERESTPLRDGSVDLEIAWCARRTGPELRSQLLFHDRFVGVCRAGHPLARRPLTTEACLACRHVMILRDGRDRGPVDAALAARGLERQTGATVGGFSGVLALARNTDLVATTVLERHTGHLRDGMHSFALPFEVSGIAVSLLWHPRLEADLAHAWFRGLVRELCGRSGSAQIAS